MNSACTSSCGRGEGGKRRTLKGRGVLESILLLKRCSNRIRGHGANAPPSSFFCFILFCFFFLLIYFLFSIFSFFLCFLFPFFRSFVRSFVCLFVFCLFLSFSPPTLLLLLLLLLLLQLFILWSSRSLGLATYFRIQLCRLLSMMSLLTLNEANLPQPRGHM